MQIQHLINGTSVSSADYFETVNPATQEVLAEVARGGERAALLRKLGDLIAKHVPEIAATETRDTGQVISQTAKQLVPRSADNFYYFAEMCVRVDGHTYPTA